MKKNRLFYLLSAICFLSMIAVLIAFAVSMQAELDALGASGEGEGLENFGISLGLAISIILLYAYAIILAPPTILKLLAVIFMRALARIGVVLDAIFIVLDVALTVVSVINNGFSTDILVLLIFVVLPLLALVFDILGIKSEKKSGGTVPSEEVSINDLHEAN